MQIKSLLTSSIIGTGLTLLLTPNVAQAFIFSFDGTSTSSNSPATGASATVDFGFSDLVNGNVLLELKITNTTGDTIFGAGATESKLTGIGFNLLSGLTVETNTYSGTSFFPVLSLNNSLSPFGNFDVATLDNNNFEGGNANDALPEGQSTLVSFEFSSLNNDNAATLETDFFKGFNDGSLAIVSRFQQVNAGAGSDKLLGGTISPAPDPDPAPTSVPEPGSLGAMALLAIGAINSLKKNQSKFSLVE